MVGTATSPSVARPGLPPGLTKAVLAVEVCLVLALSLGRSGVYALVDLIASATSPGRLGSQTALLNGSLSPGRPWIDFTLQVLGLAFGVVPVLLVAYLLRRSAESLRTVGLDGTQPVRDGARGAVIAAVIGGAGLGFYLLTYALGVDLTVVVENLPPVWWKFPVLVASAAQNALLEEVVVAGYLLHRLAQAGWSPRRALLLSAVVRGSYHLYQGLGGFAGNVVMGLVFGWLYQRWGRVTPLVVAHTLMDGVAFVGYALLAGHVGWLPTP
ncbi:MAG: CPBP family intramembrane glutamic endopeptidase [Nocardioidaceae bacterium]